jgi:hypothetical protein
MTAASPAAVSTAFDSHAMELPELTKGCKHWIQCSMPEAVSLRRLLARSVDYAGLFPPCSLELGPALVNQAEYVRSNDRWMLSAFVLPVARFNEAKPHLHQFTPDHPLRLSALGAAKESAAEFRDELKTVADAIRSVQAATDGSVVVEQLEMALPKEGTSSDLLAEVRASVQLLNIPTFWEAPAKSAASTIEMLAQTNESSGGKRLGFKLRTGGVQAAAFPPSVDIAIALAEAARDGVPIKFTAGLHHPIRQFREEVGTKMYGFLNVLGAGVMAVEHGLPADLLVSMLESENRDDFSFSDEAFKWRDWSVAGSHIEKHREVITSFGSCSFNEPREDLRLLGLS